MAAILGKAWEAYNFMFDELPDHRTKTWFLVAKPYQTLTLLAIYLIFVLKWGPKYMKRRPAYNLDKLLIVYNILQVIACIYIFYYSLILAWGWDYKWVCEPVDNSTDQKPMDIAKTTYIYFLTKVIDLLDTVFFVLRKKYSQISFLHIYHHTGMVLLIWGAVTYLPGGHGTLVGVINTFVHIIMYSYYLYTVVNPSAKQSLWWKKYITQLQIVQFFWCVVHMLAIVFKPDCAYPRWTSAVFLPQNCFILVLFIDFYIKNYIRKPQAKQIADFQKKKSINIRNVTSNSGTGSKENGAKNGHTLALNSLNNNNNDTQNSGQSPYNTSHRTQNETYSSQNGSYSTQNRSRRSLNESHYPENGSRAYENDYHINKDRKHGKSE